MKQVVFIGLFIITSFSYSENRGSMQQIKIDLLALEAEALQKNFELKKRLEKLADIQSQHSKSMQDVIKAIEELQAHYEVIQDALKSIEEVQAASYETTPDISEMAKETHAPDETTSVNVTNIQENFSNCTRDLDFDFDPGSITAQFVYVVVRGVQVGVNTVIGYLTDKGFVVTTLPDQPMYSSNRLSIKINVDNRINLNKIISDNVSIKHRFSSCRIVLLEPIYSHSLIRQAVRAAQERYNTVQEAFDRGEGVRSIQFREADLRGASFSFKNVQGVSEIVLKGKWR